MIKKSTAAPVTVETDGQRFDRILSRPQFKALKGVVDKLGVDPIALHGALITTNSYQLFLGKVGYKVEVVKQIHESDCYSRLGPKGGIRAVLPIHDTASYSTMVTLVNYNSSVTTTPNSVVFYDGQLAAFKTQFMSKTGDGE